MAHSADPSPLRPPEFRNPTIAGDLGELQREVSLRGVRTADDYLTAVGDLVARHGRFKDLFGGTAWGQIVWEKRVGTPASSTMAEAFTIVHQYRVIDGVVGGDGVAVDTGGWKDGPAPLVWDGPHDDQHYRVSFLLHGVPPWTNAVGVDLAPKVAWNPRVPAWLASRIRKVTYPASLAATWGAFWPKRDEVLTFDPFEVVWSPF